MSHTHARTHPTQHHRPTHRRVALTLAAVAAALAVGLLVTLVLVNGFAPAPSRVAAHDTSAPGRTIRVTPILAGASVQLPASAVIDDFDFEPYTQKAHLLITVPEDDLPRLLEASDFTAFFEAGVTNDEEIAQGFPADWSVVRASDTTATDVERRISYWTPTTGKKQLYLQITPAR